MANDISVIHTNMVPPSQSGGQTRPRESGHADATGRPVFADALRQTAAGRPASAVRQSAGSEEAAKASQEKLEQALSGLNALVQGLQRELQFILDEHSGDMRIQVIDKQTDEVVREIPTEEIQRIRQRLAESAGIIFADEA